MLKRGFDFAFYPPFSHCGESRVSKSVEGCARVSFCEFISVRQKRQRNVQLQAVNFHLKVPFISSHSGASVQFLLARLGDITLWIINQTGSASKYPDGMPVSVSLATSVLSQYCYKYTQVVFLCQFTGSVEMLSGSSLSCTLTPDKSSLGTTPMHAV